MDHQHKFTVFDLYFYMENSSAVAIEKSLINRRFLRIKALQNLYAFHINQQANYHHALDQIKRAFVPDVFAATPIGAAQLEEEQSQATALFEAWVLKKKPDLFMSSKDKSASVQETAQKIWTLYHSKLIQDIEALKNGWNIALENIQEAYLLILQLFIEWVQMAQFQKAHSKVASDCMCPTAFAESGFMAELQKNENFTNLLQHHAISWEKHTDLITRWYQQFIKEDVILVGSADKLNQVKEERTLITHLVEKIIFAQEDIQSFFYALDLSWEEHRPIVKKLFQEIVLKENFPQEIKDVKEIITLQNNPGSFYSDLVNNALAQEASIDELIQQHIKHWSIDRTILIDRIIIRMGICEIKFFDDVPNKVVINEYVDLAKRYSTVKSSQFINGAILGMLFSPTGGSKMRDNEGKIASQEVIEKTVKQARKILEEVELLSHQLDDHKSNV
eukprot:gene93-122_t